MGSDRERLLDLLVRHAYRCSPDVPFRLSSGRTSPFYVDCREVTMRAEARPLIGRLMAALLPPDTEAVGGLTMGADPIACAVADAAGIDVFSVRKEPKGHGTGRWVEGPVRPGARVAVVDDVVTTGASTIRAIERCREAGLVVVAVAVLVDRGEENGMDRIRKAAGPGVPVTALFSVRELEERRSATEGAARAAGAA